MGYRITRLIINLIIWLVVRYKTYGQEYVPASGAYVVVANHLGRLDPLLVYHVLDRRDIIMLVAEKYGRVAILRWFVKQLDGIFIDRFNADFTAMREVLRRLKAGGVLTLAPEGTRSKSGSLLEGKPGASFLALKANTQIIPVAIVGTEDANVVAHLRRLRRVPVVIQAGEPFTLPPIEGQDRDAALQAYTDEIMCRIAALLPPQYRGVYADHPRLKALLDSKP